MEDSICLAADTLARISSAMESSGAMRPNYWQWTALALMIICIIELIIILHTRNTKRHNVKRPADKLRAQVQNDEPIDFTNIMNSAFLSTELYNKLKVKCHPDRFVSDYSKQKLADDLFQRITQNKANYKVLQQLKQEAEETLNISI